MGALQKTKTIAGFTMTQHAPIVMSYMLMRRNVSTLFTTKLFDKSCHKLAGKLNKPTVPSRLDFWNQARKKIIIVFLVKSTPPTKHIFQGFRC